MTVEVNDIELAWKSIGKSVGELMYTTENWTCATFRKNKTKDVFFKGQTLYNLTDESKFVKFKEYGTDDWIDKEF